MVVDHTGTFKLQTLLSEENVKNLHPLTNVVF